jgi:hypothetical protein
MKTLARERDKAEILRRVGALRPEAERRWGRMSAHQTVCHLSDSLRMAIGRRPVSDATSRLQRTLVKWIVLYLPLPWPAGILTRPELDQELGGTRPADFTADLAELAMLVEFVAAGRKRHDWQAHPIFGPMSDAAWLRWAYLHTDYHLRQFGA